MNIITSKTGVNYLLQDEEIFEIIDLNDLLEYPFSKFIFIKEAINHYKLKIFDKYYSFHKCPVFCKDIYKNFLDKNSKNKRIATYILLCKQDNIFYIGSTGNITSRIYEHRKLMNKNTHYRKQLNESFIKYGKNNFDIIVIYNDTLENAINLEQSLLDFFKDDNRKINVATDARKTSLGSKQTQEQKNKTAERYRLMWKDPNKRKTILEKQKATFSTKEYKRKRSEILKKYFSKEENITNLSIKLKKHFSDPNNREKQSKTISNVHKNNLEYRKRFLEISKNRGIPISINGIKYESYNDAARKLNLDPGLVFNRVKSNLDTWKEYNKLDENGNVIIKKTYSMEDRRKKHSIKLKEYYSNPENRLKSSLALKKATSSLEIRQKMRLSRKKQYRAVSINGVIYPSISIAKDNVKTSLSNVSQRCKSKNPLFKDWFFVDEQ